jgi:beta-glucosidase
MHPCEFLAQARALLAQLTLEEKAALLSGRDTWTTKPVPRLGLPALWLADGPHGVQKSPSSGEWGIGYSLPATCFPSLCALAASWDRDLVHRVGIAMAVEAQTQGVEVLLGPGINIKRSPLGGRNFEYFSEDPLLAGELAAAFVNGIQSQGVGASVKHYAANNQETGRMVVDAQVDERTLREIYLTPWELVVKKAQPWTVMAAYNRVNGVYASQSKALLQDILVDEWGFEGIVMSDWGGVDDRVVALQAGLHLEMMGSGGVTDRQLVEAVQAGALTEARLDQMAAGMLALVLAAQVSRQPGTTFDEAGHHLIARRAAAECITLLKNDGDLLPLEAGKARTAAVIGRLAKEPRYQGLGSSYVVPTRLDNPWDELAKSAGGRFELTYADGYGVGDKPDEAALVEAVTTARAADVALLFVGVSAAQDSEGADRAHMDLPSAHNALIEAVAAAQPNVVVLLAGGSAVAMPWIAKVPAVLQAWLGGQAAGGAIADVLLGRANPSGKLPETFPKRLSDTPGFLNFPGEAGVVRYAEGVFVGYRYYDTAEVEPLFPFGHGLSYTSFGYRDLQAGKSQITDGEPLAVTLKVSNTGKRAGKEVVQLYVRDVSSRVRRPAKELRAFAKVSLAPGEEQTVTFQLDPRAFAFWDARVHAWAVESGEFELLAGASSRDIRLRTVVSVEATEVVRPPFDRYTPINVWLEDPRAREIIQPVLQGMMAAAGGEAHRAQAEGDEAGATVMWDIPIAKLILFSQGAFTEEMLGQLIAAANADN